MRKLRVGVCERSIQAVGDATAASKNERSKDRHRAVIDNRLNKELARQAKVKELKSKYNNGNGWKTGNFGGR